MEDFIKDLEYRLLKSINRVTPLIEDGASYEEMADRYEYEYDIAFDVAQLAIDKLKVLTGEAR